MLLFFLKPLCYLLSFLLDSAQLLRLFATAFSRSLPRQKVKLKGLQLPTKSSGLPALCNITLTVFQFAGRIPKLMHRLKKKCRNLIRRFNECSFDFSFLLDKNLSGKWDAVVCFDALFCKIWLWTFMIGSIRMLAVLLITLMGSRLSEVIRLEVRS